MRFNLMMRASQILADKIKNSAYKLADCKIYSEERWQPYGFIAICAVADGNVVGVVSQDMYSVEASESVKEAEKFIMNKVKQFYDS